MKVLFCGFMGSGKSTALKELEKIVPDYEFIDLDHWNLEAENKKSDQKFKSLAQLIKEKGWEYFRQLESSQLNFILENKANLILSLGGGSLNHKALKSINSQKAHLVWLNTPFELCLSRILNDPSRPLSSQSPEELEKLFIDRLPLYQQAHEIIDPKDFDWSTWWKGLPKN